MKLLKNAMTLLTLSAASVSYADCQYDPETHVGGYNAILMGHSFFRPVAQRFEWLIEDIQSNGELSRLSHSQVVFFQGGENGAPGGFDLNDSDILAELDPASPDLKCVMGLTFFPDSKNSEFGDFKDWIEIALAHNPNIKIFIGVAWTHRAIKYVDKDDIFDTEAFNAFYENGYQNEVTQLVEQLRADPDLTTEIYTIPYGRSVSSLASQIDYENSLTGNQEKPLTEDDLIDAHVGDKNDDANATRTLFKSDGIGHAWGHSEGDTRRYGQIVNTVSALQWLSAIYNVDLSNLIYTPERVEGGDTFATDLKGIAKQSNYCDPYANLYTTNRNGDLSCAWDFEPNGVVPFVLYEDEVPFALEEVQGDWYVTGGQLMISDSSIDNDNHLITRSTWADVKVTTQVKVIDDSLSDKSWEVPQLITQYLDNDNYYALYLNKLGKLILRAEINGVVKYRVTEMGTDISELNELSIASDSSQISLSFSNETVGTITRDFEIIDLFGGGSIGLQNGQAGLRAKNVDAHFESFEVSPFNN